MKPNILCIMADQMRFDAIAALGNPDIHTPNLDRLARRGVVMARAYSDCPVCVPARYAIRTGCSPLRTGSFQNEPATGEGLMEERCGEFIAKAMQRRGYRTFGIGKFHVMPPDTGIGYDVRLHCEDLEWPGDDYVNAMRRHPEYGEVEQYHGERTEMYYQPQLSPVPAGLKSESWVADRALEQMAADDGRPWFGFVSFLGPHPPFAPPVPYNRMYDPDRMRDPLAGPDEIDFMDERVRWNRYFVFAEEMCNAHFRTLRARYYGYISYIDSCIGRLLDAVEQGPDAGNTLVCFIDDHGEFLGDHQAVQKENFFEESAHVPMLLSWPGRIEPGSTCDAIAMLSDLFGLFTSAAGRPELRDGADLLGILQGRVPARETAFAYSSAPGTLDFRAMALRWPWKYVFHANGGGELLFNLGDDPREHVNRREGDSGIVRELRSALTEQMDRFPIGRRGLEGGRLKSFSRTPLKLERVYQFRHYCGTGHDGFPSVPQEVFRDNGASRPRTGMRTALLAAGLWLSAPVPAPAQSLRITGDHRIEAVNPTASAYLLETSSDLAAAEWIDLGYVDPGGACSVPAGLAGGARQGFFRLSAPPLPHAGELLVNPGFEDGWLGWRFAGDVSLQQNTNAFSGFRAVSIERVGVGEVVVGQPVPDALVQAGDRLVLKARVLPNPGCDAAAVLGVKWVDASNAPAEIATEPVAVAHPSGWVLLSLSTNVPAGAAKLEIFLEASGNAVDFTLDDLSAATWPDAWWHRLFSASFDGTGNYTAMHLGVLDNEVSSFLATGYNGLWDIDMKRDLNWGQRNAREFAKYPAVKRLVYIEGGNSRSVICRTDAQGRIRTSADEFHLLNSANPASRDYVEQNFNNGGETVWFGDWTFMAQPSNFPYSTRLGNPLPSPHDFGLQPFTDPLDGTPVVSQQQYWHTRSARPLFGDPPVPGQGDAVWMEITNSLLHADLLVATVTNAAGGFLIREGETMLFDRPYARYHAATARHAMDVLGAGMVHYDDWALGSPNYNSADAPIHVAAFREHVRTRWTDAQCAEFGFTRATLEQFDLIDYLRNPPWRAEYADRPNDEWWAAADERWLSNLVWRTFQIACLQARQRAQELVYRLNKIHAEEVAGVDVPMVANVIPTLGAAMLQRRMVDLSNFEWPLMKTYGAFPKPLGYYPQARPGIGPRMAAKITATGHTMVNPYVEPEFCGWHGSGYTNRIYETLHKVLYFDLLANRGVPTFGLTFNGMYSPGSIHSAGELHAFINRNGELLAKREYIADIGLAMGGWSQVAASPLFGGWSHSHERPFERYMGELVGWAEYLARSETFPQWDILPFDHATLPDLSRFKLVVLPSMLVVSGQNRAVLEQYLGHGGRILATGFTGGYAGPENHLLPQEEDIIAQLAADYPGQVTRTTGRPGLAYQNNPGTTEQQVLDGLLAVAANHAPVLEAVDAPPNIAIHLSESLANPGEVCVDLVNLNYDLATDTLVPVDRPGFHVRLSIKHVQEADLLSVEAIRYDEGAVDNTARETLPPAGFGFSDGALSIGVPPFGIYQALRIRRMP